MTTSGIATFTLSDGKQIPWLAWGNGTGSARDEQAVLDLTSTVLENLNHIDTAQNYDLGEQATGQALAELKPERSSFWLTTKLSNGGSSLNGDPEGEPGAAPIQIEDLKASVKGSIERLGTQPDLLLVHNPFVVPAGELKPFWQTLESLVDSGELTASLGVSNFRPQDLEELLSFARIKPVVNQIEFHPWVLAHLDPVLALHAKHGIHTQAYGPLVPVLKAKNGGALRPVLDRIAKRLSDELKEDVDPATVLLLWTRKKGATAVSSSGNKARIAQLGRTARLSDVLSQQDVHDIEAAGRKTYFRFWKPHMETDFPVPDLPVDI